MAYNRTSARNPLTRFVEREVNRLVSPAILTRESSVANFPTSPPSPEAGNSTFPTATGATGHIAYYDLDSYDDDGAIYA